MANSKVLVIIPTYNERDNMDPLIRAVFALSIGVDILVVDDNSPDGTAAEVEKLQKTFANLHLLRRPGKSGLGRAYLAGFQWGIDHGYDVLVEMDADFSHRPQDLKLLVSAMSEYDFAVGSRWVKGGGTQNWGLLRKIISRGGSFYARLILGYPLRDWTGGFNAWRKEVLLTMGLGNVKSEGYSFQIELKYRASALGFRGTEVPILFEERRVGQSKMSSRIVLEALYRVWSIRGARRS